MKNIQKLLILSMLSFFMLMGCANASDNSSDKAVVQTSPEVATSPVVLELKKGQILSFITSVYTQGEEAEAARNIYYKDALPTAMKYGFKREPITFLVNNTLVGDYNPDAFIAGSWVNKQGFDEFESLPEWPALKALRPKIWEYLRFYRIELQKPLRLEIHPDKFYTMAVAWINPENPNDYNSYLDGLEKEMNAVGGHFVYKMNNPLSEDIDPNYQGPDQLTLAEWDDEQALSRLLSSDTYKKLAPLSKSGLTKFEFHKLKSK